MTFFWPQITIHFSIKRECIEVFPIIRNVLTDLPPEMRAFVCLRWFEDEVQGLLEVTFNSNLKWRGFDPLRQTTNLWEKKQLERESARSGVVTIAETVT